MSVSHGWRAKSKKAYVFHCDKTAHSVCAVLEHNRRIFERKALNFLIFRSGTLSAISLGMNHNQGADAMTDTAITIAADRLNTAARARDVAVSAARRRLGAPAPSADALAARRAAEREWEDAYDVYRVAKGLDPVWRTA